MKQKQTRKEKILKLNFFQKIWYSITKFEKYPEMAAMGVKRAILYFTELIIIFCILYTGTYVYYINNKIEFKEENLTFSEKVITVLVGDSEDKQTLETAEILKQYNANTMIGAIGISFFISFYLAIFLDVITLSVFGLLTCLVARVKMKYKAVFNMSIFAMTLSIILRIIYSVIAMLTDFEIKYFDIMYIAVAYISLAAAIFIIRSDVMKQQLQLIKIIEESKEKIEEKINIPKKPKKEENEKKDEDGKAKENKEKEKNETEGQGSNA